MLPLVREVRPAEYTATGELLAATYAPFVTTPYLATLRDVAARAGDGTVEVLVALTPSTGRLLGTATFVRPGSGLLDVARTGEAGMRMLAVDTTARNRGVGAALVSECVARAGYVGGTALTLATLDAMTDAARLYTRLGFSRASDRDLRLPSGYALRGYEKPVRTWPAVRRATAGELAGIGDLTVNAYLAGGPSFAGTLSGGYLDELRDAEDRSREAELFVAVDRDTGELQGSVTYCASSSSYAEIARPGEAEFRMLAVAPAARRQGVGEALVRRVLQQARADGNHAVVLSSCDAMTAAHRLYRRLGFRREPERDWRPVPDLTLAVFTREV